MTTPPKLYICSASLRVLSVVALLMYFTLLSFPAEAIIEPIPLASDPRIKTMSYATDQVYKYVGYLRYQTIIELAPGEEIGTISMGDPTAWKINPQKNKLYIKPIDLDAVTNMTMITNKRTYIFEMHAEEIKDIDDPKLTFILRFEYPDDMDGGAVTHVAGVDRVPNLDEDDLSKYNFRYTITGSEDISPLRIFDDGEFTFFEFRGVNADIPAIFQVDPQGNESLINLRVRGRYVVVERVSGRYTLRHGNLVVCVFNEAWGNKQRKKPERSWFGFVPEYPDTEVHVPPPGTGSLNAAPDASSPATARSGATVK